MAPSGVPLAGMACMLTAYDQPICVHGCPIEPVLEHGIALNDLDRFLDTSAGLKFLSKHSFIIYQMPKDTLFLPAGLMIYAVYVNKNTTKHACDKEWASFIHLPAWMEKFHEHLPDGVRKAINHVNGELFQTERGKSMWEQRLEWYNVVWKSLVGRGD